jgi:hypothetical protein
MHSEYKKAIESKAHQEASLLNWEKKFKPWTTQQKGVCE